MPEDVNLATYNADALTEDLSVAVPATPAAPQAVPTELPAEAQQIPRNSA